MEYIDLEYMKSELISIYKAARDKFCESETEKAELQNYFDDEYIEMMSETMVDKINENVNNYLHLKNHHMSGNFNNIDLAYSVHITGKIQHNRHLVDEMTERLDKNDKSEQTKQDRHWLVDWFFETCGTVGIVYNFQSYMSDYLYQIKQKEQC